MRRGRLRALSTRRPRAERRRRVRAKRFAAAYALLALIVAGAAVAAYFAVSRPVHRARAPTLVPAQTTGLGTYALKSIAAAVQREYRLPNRTPLTGIIARPSSPPQFVTPQGPVAISTLIVHSGFPIEDPGDVRPFDVSKAALYMMCGTASACAIPIRPSPAVGAMLDREVLELTLRTLEKVQSVDSVLTFVPPASAKVVVYLTRADLSKQLAEPLSAALPRVKADVPGTLSPAQERALRTLIGAHSFSIRGINELPDGSAYLSAAPIG